MAFIERFERHVSSRLPLKLESSAMSASRKVVPSAHDVISHHQSRIEKRTGIREVCMVDVVAGSSEELVDCGKHVSELLLDMDTPSSGDAATGTTGCVSMLARG
jgi:hypothetical protein